MIIMVLGSSGQLGTALQKRAVGDRVNVWHFLTKEQADVRNERELLERADLVNPDMIINCAGLTDVDALEHNRETAFAVNAYGAENAAKMAREINVGLIHISTDYVFDGKKIVENGKQRPYRETDPPNPLMVYGKSKLLGEQLIQRRMSKYIILRTAWLYGGAHSFVAKIVKQAVTGSTLRVADDQIGTPTSVVELTNAIFSLMHTEHYGLYHSSCKGEASWYDFACEILKQKKLTNCIMPISMKELNHTAKRPSYSVLDNGRLTQLQVYQFSHWKTALARYLKNYTTDDFVNNKI